MTRHCATCACTPVEVVHECEWCRINLNHPKCPENEGLYPPCPNCGSDPEDVTLHARTCPTPELMVT